ncbi:DUF3159 domain-containing protein [Natronoglycomyces albus]|uniref:DUF3159 domain-containing protein n=1 Tax=Natronoglycomyces albus TaxID=2811108 RepID=A0A895XRR6_9ACTN|nr:DUF3159 domain-containing protein [Natronoglycomyces albus]QSB06392.1 DUF3159 domain-containing protein [Natronoglycomyces albus]
MTDIPASGTTSAEDRNSDLSAGALRSQEAPRDSEGTADDSGGSSAAPVPSSDLGSEASAERTGHRSAKSDDEEEPLPPFTEQLSEQLGGVRGLVEAAVPITVFVILNLALPSQIGPFTGLQWAVGSAVAVAVAIAIFRAIKREPVRHAINGLIGIALGAFLALRTGEARQMFLPGIIQGGLYGVALVASAAIRHPIIGWIWSIIADGGKKTWRSNPDLVRVFCQLTFVWGAVFILKNLARLWMYLVDAETLLGITTIVTGWPLTLALTALTVWAVRRVTNRDDHQLLAGSDIVPPTARTSSIH